MARLTLFIQIAYTSKYVLKINVLTPAACLRLSNACSIRMQSCNNITF